MDPFPEEQELIKFFECKPELTDPELPWAYNSVTFKVESGEDQIECEIAPANEILRFQWDRGGQRLLKLDLNWVCGLETRTESGTEALIAHFRDKNLTPLRIQLRPTVSVSWGTETQPIQ